MSVRRTNVQRWGSWPLLAVALVALAAWPLSVGGFAAHGAPRPLAGPTAAPVKADYLGRDQTIAFLETRIGRDRSDALIPRMLSGAYLQRYRERGDLGDVVRVEHDAQVSLAALPRGNTAGVLALAAALTALHRFKEAEALLTRMRRSAPDDPGLILADASVSLELGDYPRAETLIAESGTTPGAQIDAARFAEETGSVAAARARLTAVMQQADSIYDTPAERRAWFHFRVGELDFLTGDNDAAIAAEHDAIAIFPDDALAWNALARILVANRRWTEARDAAAHGAGLVPSPETLGYLADAQTALGDAPAAAATRDEIVAIERIGNAQHVSDRLLAMYYADHGIRLDDAYAIARRELQVRDDIYTEDTLAWTAAKAGRWDVARAAAAKATRFNTQDPRFEYHAGVIARHFGDNPHFHPVDAGSASAAPSTL